MSASTYLDENPSPWPTLSLGELTASTRPICYGVLKPGPHVEEGVPLIRIQDLVDGTVRRDEVHLISAELDHEFARSRLEGGEVLISIQGTIGRVAICPEPLARANISRTLAVIKPDGRVRTEFLAHYLRLLNEASAFPTQGATRASLNIGALRQVRVPVPPLHEQDHIVARIEVLSHNIVIGEQMFGSALRACDELKAALLGELFDTRFPRRRLDAAADVFLGFTPSRKSRDLWEGDVPWVSSGEVAFCRIGSTAETISEAALGNRARRLNPPGTVLLAMYGEGKTRGQAAILDIAAATNQAVAAIRVHEDALTPEFLYYCLMAQYAAIRQVGQGGQQINLNGELVRAIEVPMPAVPVQRALVAALEPRLAAVEDMKGNLHKSLLRSRQLRVSLLHSAFSGQLNPRVATGSALDGQSDINDAEAAERRLVRS